MQPGEKREVTAMRKARDTPRRQDMLSDYQLRDALGAHEGKGGGFWP